MHDKITVKRIYGYSNLKSENHDKHGGKMSQQVEYMQVQNGTRQDVQSSKSHVVGMSFKKVKVCISDYRIIACVCMFMEFVDLYLN